MLLADQSDSASIAARSLTGDEISLRTRDIEDLAASMRGRVLVAGQGEYEQARRVWNAMFDKHPALIARCASPSDVMRAVSFAQSHRLLTAVRAGGHSVSGKSTCNGGMMIDVSPMQGVRVDPVSQVAYVEGGALLGHLDRETSAFSLVTTAGTVSHTGAAGLTLGGGFGRVGRRFGLACDNLRSVDIVTADGRLLNASEQENADLFWGLRGGGGNFGVATAFEYQLHPMSPTVLAGRIAWPIEKAREILKFYAEFSANAPDELEIDPGTFRSPDGPLISIQACWSADLDRGEKVLRALRSFASPVLDDIKPMSYVKLQSSADIPHGHGRRFYTKAGFFSEITPNVMDALVHTFESASRTGFGIGVQQGGGAIGRKPQNFCAFPNRDGNYWLLLIAGWTDPALDEQNIQNMKNAWQHIEPLTNGFYTNTMSDAEDSKVAANFGANYPRLQQIKRKYDPTNQFRLNANVLPA
jgi:FAD/FMN-containing dehydrogenase